MYTGFQDFAFKNAHLHHYSEVASSDPFSMMARQMASLADEAKRAARSKSVAQMERAMHTTATEVRITRRVMKVTTGGLAAEAALQAFEKRDAMHSTAASTSSTTRAKVFRPSSARLAGTSSRGVGGGCGYGQTVSAGGGGTSRPAFFARIPQRPSSARPASAAAPRSTSGVSHTARQSGGSSRPVSARPASASSDCLPVRSSSVLPRHPGVAVPRTRLEPRSAATAATAGGISGRGGTGGGGGIPGLEAARLRLLQAREEVEFRLVEAAVAESAGTSENVSDAGRGGREALVALLRRGDDLDERNVYTVIDRLRALEAVERVAEWRKLKAAESRRRSRALRAAEAARLSSVETKFAQKEEKNVIKYEEWVQRKSQAVKAQPRAPKPEEMRRRAVEEALRKEAEVREKNREAMAAWRAVKAAEEAECRRRETAARRRQDAEMAMRRLESDIWMKHHRFHEPCDLYVAPPPSVFSSTMY